MPRRDYDDRQEARRARLEARAAKADAEADALARRVDTMAGCMNGTPILIGHHSERRHRRDLERMHRDMTRSVQAGRDAERLRERAAAVGSAGISSDDPEAGAKIDARLDALRARRERMKAVNAAWRKAKKPAPGEAAAWAALSALRPEDDTWAALVTEGRHTLCLDPLRRGPFPDYALTNLGANIRRLEKRLAEVQEAERAAEEAGGEDGTRVLYDNGAGMTVTENYDANRVQVEFPGKPSAEVRATLKAQGFRWAPSEGAWQRLLNDAGRAAARRLIYALDGPVADL